MNFFLKSMKFILYSFYPMYIFNNLWVTSRNIYARHWGSERSMWEIIYVWWLYTWCLSYSTKPSRFNQWRIKWRISVKNGARNPLSLFSNKYFYFYTKLVKDFGVSILFTIMQSEILKVINVSPSQLHPNGCAFI